MLSGTRAALARGERAAETSRGCVLHDAAAGSFYRDPPCDRGDSWITGVPGKRFVCWGGDYPISPVGHYFGMDEEQLKDVR